MTKKQKEAADERWRNNRAKEYDEERGIVRDDEGTAHYMTDPNDPTKPGDFWYTKEFTPQERYAYNLANHYDDGRSDFMKRYNIVLEELKNGKNLDQYGGINQRGNARIAQKL